MRRFALAVLVSACAGLPTHAAIPSTGEVAATREQTVALVEGGRSYCSGVWIGEQTILTAAHCVHDAQIGDLVMYSTPSDVGDDGESVKSRSGEIEAVDAAHDLALIHALAPPSHLVAKVSSRQVAQGEPVHTMGAPYGLWWSYSRGEISAVRVLEDPEVGSILYVQTTAPIFPGSSGGALFDAQGEVVGVARAMYRSSPSLNLFVHGNHIRRFLKAHM